MSDPAAIIERVIRAIIPGATNVTVIFNEDEDITAVIDGVTYVHTTTSDDYGFVFRNDDDEVETIVFTIPSDYGI